MNTQETTSRNPRFGMFAAVGVVVIGIATVILRMPHRSVPVAGNQIFFTVDDGKTWFPDSAARIPPFDKDGREAVCAHVYRCADGTQFVNYLERFKPDAKQTLENLNTPDPNRKGPTDMNAIRTAYLGGREVKRPGDANWVSAGDFRQVAQVTALKCPNGGTDAVAVEP